MGFPGGSDGEESAYNAGNLALVPGSGRSPGEGTVYSFLPGECQGQRSLGGLQSMGSQRAGHDWVTNIITYTYIHTKAHIHADRFESGKYIGQLAT